MSETTWRPNQTDPLVLEVTEKRESIDGSKWFVCMATRGTFFIACGMQWPASDQEFDEIPVGARFKFAIPKEFGSLADPTRSPLLIFRELDR